MPEVEEEPLVVVVVEPAVLEEVVQVVTLHKVRQVLQILEEELVVRI